VIVETLVVDASAIITLLIDPGRAGVDIAKRIGTAQLHAPDHLPVEVTNVLRRHRNAGRLSEAEARLALDGFWSVPVQLWPFEVMEARAWQLGNNVTSYDAAYVALAEHLTARLLTADARLPRAPGPTCEIEVFA
jgi:predicted nucleic acid-binding protein